MRSDCPVNYALEMFGDKWTFLVLRDLFQGKRFYKDFKSSKEGIATNILSDRLKKLEAHGIIESKVYEQLKTKKEYKLTEKGLALIPVLIEMILWSNQFKKGLAVEDSFIIEAKRDRTNLVNKIRNHLQ